MDKAADQIVVVYMHRDTKIRVESETNEARSPKLHFFPFRSLGKLVQTLKASALKSIFRRCYTRSKDRSAIDLFETCSSILARSHPGFYGSCIVDPLDWQQVETKKKGVRAFGKKKKKRNLVFKTEKKK